MQNNQRIKLLKIVDILQRETDDAHPLKTSELCARLFDLSISCDRRTLYRDIDLLNEHGYEIMKTRVGHEMGYYITDRSFSIPELKIIIDAIQAANFITEKKTAELIDKVAALGGTHQAEILSGNLVRFNTRKHSNEAVYYMVGFLQDALRQNRKVTFLYFDLNENAQRVYRKNKSRYIAEPISLVYYEDNYYLVCYNAEHPDKKTTYRIDRMDCVEISDEAISEGALAQRSDTDMAEYTEQTFRMFGGPAKRVTLHFDDSLIGAVFDKFGEDIKITRLDENTCSAVVRVQISPMFWGWVFQFGGRLRIAAPKRIVNEYHAYHKVN